MKKLTKAQRRKIYLEVASRFQSNNSTYIFLCGELLLLYNNERWHESQIDTGDLKKLFCEFGLFEPTEPYLVSWPFDSVYARITCMLLCYEMTKS